MSSPVEWRMTLKPEGAAKKAPGGSVPHYISSNC